jgi:hypothetical protein
LSAKSVLSVQPQWSLALEIEDESRSHRRYWESW